MIDRWQQFEDRLGDQHDGRDPFSMAAMLEADRAGVFPGSACRLLAASGFGQEMVPAAHGGRLTDLESLHQLTRALTRRNAALMPAVMYGIGPALLGAMAASPAQQRDIFAATAACTPIALALAERGAGSDLANARATARETSAGWRISGEKWPIGRYRDAGRVVVLARTDDAGPASFSLFLVDNPAHGGPAERLPTGMRGTDVGSITFTDTIVAADGLVGQRGRGLELTFKLQGLIKLMSAAANLGALDTALRLAMDLACDPDRPLLGHEHVRCLLLDLYLDLLALDALTGVGLRAASLAPGQVSVLASSVKVAAIAASRRATQHLQTLFGTGMALAATLRHQFLAKVLQDMAVVQVMDTNEVANLRNLATQLDGMGRRLPATDPKIALAAVVELGRLGGALPAARLADISMLNAGGDLLMAALGALAESRPDVSVLVERRDAFFLALAEAKQALGRDFAGSAWLIEAARDYATLQQAAAAVLVRAALGPAALPDLALARLLHGKLPLASAFSDARAATWEQLMTHHAREQTFAICPVALGKRSPDYRERACA